MNFILIYHLHLYVLTLLDYVYQCTLYKYNHVDMPKTIGHEIKDIVFTLAQTI